MPVRSLTSRVLKWPDAATVRRAVGEWARQLARDHPEILRIGCFGSYARGDWGVGSDLDLVLVVAHSEVPFARRACHFDASGLPLPADLLVYTEAEWQGLEPQARWARTLREQLLWVYEREGPRAL